MAKMIPLIGSSEAGPLGAIHLPRLWLKVSLSANDALNDEYDECGAGFDQMVLDGLGLDRDGALDYIKTNQPTYPQFEQWVVDQNGGSIDPVSDRCFERGDQRLSPRGRHGGGYLGTRPRRTGTVR